MKQKNAIRPLCGALLLLVAALVVWEFISAHRIEAAAAAARTTHGELLERLAKLRSALGRMSRVPANLKSADGAEVPLKNVDTPEQLSKRLHVLHAWMSLRYSRLYRKAGFSPDQIRQFEALLEDHYLRNLDLVETARAQGLPFTNPAIAQLAKEENARYSAAQAAALGSQLATAVNEDQRTASVREMAEAVAGSTYFTQPLGAAQADQLTQILASNSTSYGNGGAAKVGDLNMAAALTQAQSVLSTEQLAALKNLYDGNQSLKAYELALAAATKPH
jgi:hypothetical protein